MYSKNVYVYAEQTKTGWPFCFESQVENQNHTPHILCEFVLSFDNLESLSEHLLLWYDQYGHMWLAVL